MEKLCWCVCTDGAAAMTGQDLGFTAFAKAGNDHITFRHCIIHQEELVVKKIALELMLSFLMLSKTLTLLKVEHLIVDCLKICALIWIWIIQVYCYMLKLGGYQEVEV